MPKSKKKQSPIRGRWCHTCNGRGNLPLGNRENIQECPDCHYVGFVGVTSEQVREAELMAMRETQA